MALDFPNTPALNDVYAYGNYSWQWNGTAWKSIIGSSYLAAHLSTNAQTGTTYTLTTADDGYLVELNNASAITVTLPANSTAAFASGSQITLLQTGTGQVSVSPAAITTATYASGGASGATTFVISATNANIAIGQLVTGTGFAANTLVTNVSTTTITIDTPTTAQVAGTITFSVGLVATPGYKLRTKYSSATLVKRNVAGNNSWVLLGDLAA